MADSIPPEDIEHEIDDDAAITAELQKLASLESTEATEVVGASSITKPKRKAPIGLKIFLWLLLVVILATAGAAGWVIWTDYQAVDIIPEGVTFGGASMGGYTSDEARAEVTDAIENLRQASIAASLASIPATSTFRTGEPTATVADFIEFNAEQTIKEIVDARGQSDLIARARHDFLGEPIVREAQLAYSVDEGRLAEYINQLGDHYQSKAINAKLSQSKGEIHLRKSEEGFRPDPVSSEAAAKAALLTYVDSFHTNSGDVEFDFSGQVIKPKTPTSKLEKSPAIVVSLSNRRVTLYNGEDKIKSYPCAIGTPSHPTPVGNWKIVQKRRNPVWRNPGSDWAKNMPASIGPSASSPLGLRALNLDATNIRLHGTTNIGSVGTAASHGCLRMHNNDIIDLFDRVKVGTPVFIIR